MRTDNTSAGLSVLAACTADVRQWYMQNCLQLNTDKSEALIVGTAHQLRAATSTVSSVTVADVNLPLANEMKVLGVILDRHLTDEKHVSAIARSCNYHKPSATFTICCGFNLHRRLPVVWYCQGSTTATPCSTVFHAAISRSYSVFRTVQHGSFFRRQGDHTPNHYYASCTGCRFTIESRTSWRYWRTRSGPHRCQRI